MRATIVDGLQEELGRVTWGLNTDDFISHEAGSPFAWIEPGTAQYPKSTLMTCVVARGGPIPIRSSHGVSGVAGQEFFFY